MDNSEDDHDLYITAKEAKNYFPEQYDAVLKYKIAIFTPSIKKQFSCKDIEEKFDYSVETCSPVELRYVDKDRLILCFSVTP